MLACTACVRPLLVRGCPTLSPWGQGVPQVPIRSVPVMYCTRRANANPLSALKACPREWDKRGKAHCLQWHFAQCAHLCSGRRRSRIAQDGRAQTSAKRVNSICANELTPLPSLRPTLGVRRDLGATLRP